MNEFTPEEVEKFMKKYKSKLDNSLNSVFHLPPENESRPIFSKEYLDFKETYMPPHLNLYEKFCETSLKIYKAKPSEAQAKKLQAYIDTCHINTTPAGVISFATVMPLMIFLLGFLTFVFVPLVISTIFMTSFNLQIFLLISMLIFAVTLYPILLNIPKMFASNWRMKASNQMVIGVFYIVTYMRHTSNLENAINFAADHIKPPLSLDLKKVIWDVETQKYESLKESLDTYLEGWREYNLEFVDSMHLIESSLYETTEERRIQMLDKALDVILSETYEKMLHYAHDLKSPITMLVMLGVILPVLGLVILPLLVSFMPTIKWYHIGVIYDIILPLMVFYLGKKILLTRPTGYGDSDIGIQDYDEKTKIRFKIGGREYAMKAISYALIVFFMFSFIAILPLLVHTAIPDFDFCLGTPAGSSATWQPLFPAQIAEIKASGEGNTGVCFLGYIDETDETGAKTGNLIGPFGLGAALFSFLFPLGLGLSLGAYFKAKSKNLMKTRNQTKKLESEFGSALFQLGNRLGDGLPAEIAFDRVSQVMVDTSAGKFFQIISSNIHRLGMGIQQAIFDSKIGALVYYPSSLIESSMKVLGDGIKKGPLIAANALLNISRYIKEIHNVDERLKDILGEIISQLKSNVSFLAPVIAGIVIGITSMISTILITLGSSGNAFENADTNNIIAGFFRAGIPSYHFQIVVGTYLVLLVYILTIIANSIENGTDTISKHHSLSVNLPKSTIMYIIVGLIVMVLFNIIAAGIMSTLY